MSTEQPVLHGKEELTQHILRFIEGHAGKLERIVPNRQADPRWARPLISIEAGGVRVDTSAGWWYCDTPFFVVSILRALEVPIINRLEVIAWIKKQQHANGYFRSGNLGLAVRDATRRACAMLRCLGAERDEASWDRARLVEILRAQQRPGEHRQFVHLLRDRKESCSEPAVASCCIASLGALGETLADPEAAKRYIQGKQQAHGAFSCGWLPLYRARPEGWATFSAIRALTLLGAQPRDPGACVSQVQSWQLVDGGFDAISSRDPRYPQISNMLETSAALQTLHLLNAEPLDSDRCRERIAQLWVPEEGGFCVLISPGRSADLEPTYWAVLAMAALGMLGPAKPHWRELFLYSDR